MTFAPSDFLRDGWIKFQRDPNVLKWITHVLPAARQSVLDPEMRRDWLRSDGTWFVGVNALANDAGGRVAGGPPLAGSAMDFIRDGLGLGDLPLDRAQISVVWPGYPRRDGRESDAAFRFRRDRDAAHVDGIKRHPGAGFRHIGECHAYLLGLPLTATGKGASPLVLWEGSHEVMRRGLSRALEGMAAEDAGQADLSDAYAAARRQVFAECDRIELPAQPGEAYLLHRLTLHGVAPWAQDADGGPDGRMIAYFRPQMPVRVKEWLTYP